MPTTKQQQKKPKPEQTNTKTTNQKPKKPTNNPNNKKSNHLPTNQRNKTIKKPKPTPNQDETKPTKKSKQPKQRQKNAHPLCPTPPQYQPPLITETQTTTHKPTKITTQTSQPPLFVPFSQGWGKTEIHQPAPVQEEREGFAFNEPSLYSASRSVSDPLCYSSWQSIYFCVTPLKVVDFQKACPQMVFEMQI